MPIDPSIISAGVPQPGLFNNPFATLQAYRQQFAQADAQRQESQLRQQQIDAAKTQEQDRVKKQQDAEQLDQIFKAIPLGDPDYRTKVLTAVQQASPGQLPQIQSSFAAADEKAALTKQHAVEASKAQQETANALDEQLAHYGAELHAYGDTPMGLALISQHLVAAHPELGSQVQEKLDRVAQGQMTIKQVGDGLIARSLSAQKQANEAPGQQATSAINQQVAAATVGGMTPAQQAEDKARQLAGAQRAQELAQGGLRLNIEQQNADTQRANVEGSSLTPQSLDKVAEMFATTGQLPPLGIGASAAKDRRQIINRAAEMFPNVALASSAAAYQSNKSSLTNVQKTLDTLTAFESTAGKNLDQFLSLAAKVPDTGSPWANLPVRTLSANVVGATNVPAMNAARDVALREIARVTNDPKLSGALTDSARAQVSALSPDTATFNQIKAVAQVLRQDMANVNSSLTDQRDAIQGRIGASASAGGSVPRGTSVPPASPKVGDIWQSPTGPVKWDGTRWKAGG